MEFSILVDDKMTTLKPVYHILAMHRLLYNNETPAKCVHHQNHFAHDQHLIRITEASSRWKCSLTSKTWRLLKPLVPRSQTTALLVIPSGLCHPGKYLPITTEYLVFDAKARLVFVNWDSRLLAEQAQLVLVVL